MKLFVLLAALLLPLTLAASEPSRTYENKLVRLQNPPPLLADYPEFVAPVKELVRYEAPVLVDDASADLLVRARHCRSAEPPARRRHRHHLRASLGH